MPKFKVPKAVKDRFKITASGKVLHRKSGRRHLVNSKSPSNMRRGKQLNQVTGAWEKKIKMLLGI